KSFDAAEHVLSRKLPRIRVSDRSTSNRNHAHLFRQIEQPLVGRDLPGKIGALNLYENVFATVESDQAIQDRPSRCVIPSDESKVDRPFVASSETKQPFCMAFEPFPIA